MKEIALEVVKKLPIWYLEMLIPIIIVIGIWVFSHLRRDKQGKLYWFRRNYEDRKLIGKLDDIMKNAEDMKRRVMRLELLDLISHKPRARETILTEYDKYKKEGFNSYMDDVVKDWKAGLENK
jgi:hypothetical protein